MGIAKLPLAKELVDLSFEGTPINAGLIEQLSAGGFLETKRVAAKRAFGTTRADRRHRNPA